MNGNKQHYGRLVALMAVASLAFMALGGVVSAESINTSDGSVSGDVSINGSSGNVTFNATATPTYSDDLDDRWSYDATPPENVVDGPNGQLENNSDVSLVSGYGGGAYQFQNEAYHNVTSGARITAPWTVAFTANWDTSKTYAMTLAEFGRADDSAITLKIKTKDIDNDGDTDDVTARIVSLTGTTSLNAQNVSALQANNNLNTFVASHDGDRFKLKINGTEVFNQTAAVYSAGQQMMIGGNPGTVTSTPNRTIDEVRIYNKSLSNSSKQELRGELGEPAKIDHYFPDGGFTSPAFDVTSKSLVATHLATINKATVDVYVERNDSGTWRVSNSTEGVTSAGWVNLTTDGFFADDRRVRVNWSASDSTTSTIDRILGGGGSSGGALFVIPVLLIGVSAEMAGVGVVAAVVAALAAFWWWRD